MSALYIPEAGLSLRRDDPPAVDGPPSKPTQIMRLNLAQSTLDELIQSLRNDQKARIRLGKHQTLYYGSKFQQFHSVPEAHRSEIYTCTPGDRENLYFTGLLSHTLEVQKAKEATAATDQALANLEQSLHAFERGKESKKTHIITDIDQVRALKSGKNRPSRLPTGRSDLEKDRLFNKHHAASRSLSSSPLGLSLSPASHPAPTPTSAPLPQSKDQIRLDALKVPLIHLLAVRAVSAKYLARQTRSSLDDCLTLVRKYGVENRLDREKFDLKDKAYRELDVWKFPYPSQEDRQEAIENAISAFDRMRISRSDKLWQSLLPKEERGKGKVLSRLDLRTGPVKKSLTPRIQIHASEDTTKEGYTTGTETDRTNNNGLAPRTAEKTKDVAPQKAGIAAAKKKRASEKDAPAKRGPAKGKNANNSTLTGRVTKKAERKPVSKIKSAEFVHDSDEDDTDMPDAASSSSSSLAVKQHQTQQKAQPSPSPNTSHDKPNSSHAATSRAAKPDSRPVPKQSPQGARTTATAAATATTSQKHPPSQLSKSASPRKPSPVRYSPPTNSSDSRGHSRSSSRNTATSSSSSSPLIAQVSKGRQPDRPANPPASKSIKPNGGVNGTSNGVAKPKRETAVPLKRKAEPQQPPVTESQNAGRPNGHVDHKRRRATSISSGSTGSDSPSMGREFLLQQLREKSQRFKQYYAKYRALHDSLASLVNPPQADLEKLQLQHKRLQRMKEEIWDEDRRLRKGP
ncbi:hypothetical protein MPDQ_002582 [Monascus purpureus]|uniref:Uncharacterized protein n=1 Tax=Monascus purpureus TaxID=5098 RepID=A0A507QKC2_MONPU|nr:hypothetical protein MPDQ_002582 [Monascus purpureus]